MVINFDFRRGAKKSSHLDNPLQSYGKICFNIFQYILRKAGLIWFNTSWIKNKNIFINDMTWAIPSLRSEKFRKLEPPKKVFCSENMIFWGFRLSLDHFGRQAPKSPVSLLQNGVSTSSLPPFIVDLSAF